MNTIDVKLLGLQCENATDLYDLFSSIKQGYLEKRALISNKLIEDISDAMDGVEIDLSNLKRRITNEN